jgi:hypothetical protein
MNPLRSWISTLLLVSFVRLQFACCGVEVAVCQAAEIVAARSCLCPQGCGERHRASAEVSSQPSSARALDGPRPVLVSESSCPPHVVTDLSLQVARAIAHTEWEHLPQEQPVPHLYLMAHAGMLFSYGRAALASQPWSTATTIASSSARIFLSLACDHRSSPKWVDDRPHERIRLRRLRI